MFYKIKEWKQNYFKYPPNYVQIPINKKVNALFLHMNLDKMC